MSTSGLTHLPASILAILTVRDYGMGLLLYGLTIIAQGPHRWSGPQFVTTVNLAPSYAWGAVYATCGALILLGHFTYRFLLRNVGLYAGAVMILGLGLTTFREALRHDHVSFAGAVFCGFVSVAMFIVARAKEERPDASGPEGS